MDVVLRRVSLPCKIEMIGKVEAGGSYAGVGRFYSVNKSTERSIVENKDANLHTFND